jgi:hypothetical protein
MTQQKISQVGEEIMVGCSGLFSLTLKGSVLRLYKGK